MIQYTYLPIGLTVIVLALSGCQVVSVKQQKLGITMSSERDSILTQDKLSEASLNVLSMTGREAKKCIVDPEGCLHDIQQIPEVPDEQFLSTGSEIYLANANQLKSDSQCNAKNLEKKFKDDQTKQEITQQYQSCMRNQLEALNQSIRYSYAYLFSSKRPPQQRLFDNRQVQVRDFYNQAIANLINIYNDQTTQAPTNFNKPILIGKSRYHIDLSQYPSLHLDQVDKLISTYNLKFSGLRSMSRRDGFGSEFVIEMKKDQEKQFNQYMPNPFVQSKDLKDHPNIHQALYVPATIVIEPQHKNSLKEILNDSDLQLRVIDPNLYLEIHIEQQKYPLAANFSAPYGLWLANNKLGASAYLSLIDREKNLVMPHLFMLEPYNPNKKIIVMIHGLASSPEAWIAVTNDIMGDTTLRDNFQVWQIFYSTNMPIIESRYQIYALLKQSFDQLAVQFPNKPPSHTVLIGHSMGGVISRLLVSDNDFTPQILEYLQKKDFKQYQEIKDFPLAHQRLAMHALVPPVDRAIFISSPFQGTDYADRWFTLVARKIIRLPQSFISATLDTITHGINSEQLNPKELIDHFGRDLIQNGPSDLSKKSAFTQITENAQISPQVKYHLIIGNNTDAIDPDKMTDGVVTYQSAHLDHAQSEKIIHGGHSIQYTPEAVLELRRILRLHLTELGKYQP
ncbi:alpha/beta hydrolase [Acinetobacter qingfengensis]|uniref:Alpha/beta hydrolase n=1 Tax=Acinetobacter qingfengensis TaxID=1262585 RepID=A0A1E7REV4_9GAMM|nr:alpha/beta fold hydrolase [Acinetobacter qingfengensis]KAA8735620.1 alpha/beta hydrolase [Acinetobacter qingfengensis]OEY97930.1 alpha/beta hydrolase [Acinetobacter qingfengensis]